MRGCLTIDLGRIAKNWQFFDARSGDCETGVVVKADAYGLGVAAVAEVLVKAGARTFFVADGAEGGALRKHVGSQQRIFVFHGCGAGEEAYFKENRLIPVLNSVEAIKRWVKFAANSDYNSAAIHVDTGMNRLGLGLSDFHLFCKDADLHGGFDIQLIMSHLISGDMTGDQCAETQLAQFKGLMQALPSSLGDVSLSLSNSAGALRGGEYLFDVSRVGIGLYGGNPFSDADCLLQNVVTLMTPVLQIRHIGAGQTVGYGATWRATRETRLVTLGIGYADGLLRSCGGRGVVAIDRNRAPIVGRISMDLITADVTDLPVSVFKEGQMVEIIGDTITVNEVAAAAGTISYEILTSLGQRYERRYV